MKKQPTKKSTFGQRMVAGFEAIADALESGEPMDDIKKRFTARTVKAAAVAEKPFGPDDMKAARGRLKASQTVLAKFLGVSPQTLRGWEQGTRGVPPMAVRFLEVVEAHPQIWAEHVRPSGK